MEEALDALEARGIHLDTLRIRAFPFHDDVFDFIGNHERVFVVEQNRDKQMRTLLTTELRDRPGPARADPALRRHADHGALHRQGDRRHALGRHPRPAAQGAAVIRIHHASREDVQAEADREPAARALRTPRVSAVNDSLRSA